MGHGGYRVPPVVQRLRLGMSFVYMHKCPYTQTSEWMAEATSGSDTPEDPLRTDDLTQLCMKSMTASFHVLRATLMGNTKSNVLAWNFAQCDPRACWQRQERQPAGYLEAGNRLASRCLAYVWEAGAACIVSCGVYGRFATHHSFVSEDLDS